MKGKGIKLLTKDGQGGEYISPEVALRNNLSCLSWDHMLDRNHGELLVDVGISFTPKSKDPVIGLWRLDSLEESYAAAGFNLGTVHHHCMLYRYGALQAEMPEDRALQTHVAFRNTYNIYYEAVRPNNNKPTFGTDSDAYNLTSTYHKECSSTIKILGKAKGKTYGVRDEYRVSGQAAQVLLREALPVVGCHVPFAFISAETPFRLGDIWHQSQSFGCLPMSGLVFSPGEWRKSKEPRSS